MTFIPKLYFSPGAVSMATHVALEEVGSPYELVPILIKEEQQRSARYLEVHGLGRVPALEVAPGVILTETPALLGYLADQAPELQLLPRGGLERARANEWMSLFASTLHATFASFFRPERYTSDPAAAAALKVDGRTRFAGLLEYVEHRLPAQGYLLGARYSLCDAYLTVFFLWAERMGLELTALPRYQAIAGQVLQRPAVQRMLQQEGLRPA
jgi:glutathione S-transferase